MTHPISSKIWQLVRWSLPLLLVTTLDAAEPPKGTPQETAYIAITAALKSQGVKEPVVISYADLTEGFGTRSAWALAVVRENVPRDQEGDEHGPIFVCFLREHSPACLDGSGSATHIDESNDRIPFDLYDARIVQASPDGKNPRLLVKTCTESSPNGNCGIDTTLYVYDKTADRFNPEFHNVTGRNNNQRTRFIEGGPIRGDIVATYPTTDAPYTYWVEVYRQQGGEKYTRILRYRGKTEYGDNNSLAVVDSEMPETLRRLGLWKSGDPLPVPEKLPAGCKTLFLRNGVEWCK